MLKTITAFISMLFIPRMETYHVDPFLFWVQCMLAGTFWGLAALGLWGIWFWYFSGEFDLWEEDPS